MVAIPETPCRPSGDSRASALRLMTEAGRLDGFGSQFSRAVECATPAGGPCVSSKRVSSQFETTGEDDYVIPGALQKGKCFFIR